MNKKVKKGVLLLLVWPLALVVIVVGLAGSLGGIVLLGSIICWPFVVFPVLYSCGIISVFGLYGGLALIIPWGAIFGGVMNAISNGELENKWR